MKKLFLFIVALLASLMVGATIHTLEPGVDKIKGLIDAGTLADGDVIELQTDTYTEWHSLTFDKKVTIKAAEGAFPKLALYDWQIQNDFEINGVEIKNVSKDNYLFQVTGEVAGTVAFKNCSMQLNEEVTNPVSYINVKEGKTVGTLVIDSCTFAPNAKTEGSIVYGLTTVNNFTMTNSTAVACGGTDLAVYMSGLTTATVDHCTFYNCGARVLYLKGDAMTSCTVSNCIVANAALVDQYCVATYAGTVDNVLYYNTKAPRSSDATVNGCINEDPMFVDAANGNFNFSVFSPLFFAATDGRHIGDPRWISVAGEGINLSVTLNKKNVGAVSADMTYCGENDEYFDFGPHDSLNDTLRWAKWLVNVNKRAYSVSAELTSANGYKLVLDVIDPSTGAVVLTSDTAKTPSFNTIDFSGLEEKSYILRLKNRQGWSKVKVKSLTFTYAGGAVVDIPDTLPVADAILSSGASINEDGYITYHNAGTDNARWNINATKSGSMSVTMDVVTTNGHIYMVALYSMEGDSITAVKEHGWTNDSGIMKLEGTIDIPQAGNYYVVVKNTLGGSTAVYKDVTFTYAGGGVVDAGLLPNDDAVLVGKVARDENNNIKSSGSGDVPTEEYFYWNVNFEKAGYYAVAMNVAAPSEGSASGHYYHIYLNNDEQAITEETQQNWGASECTLTVSPILIATPGIYVVKVINTTANSSALFNSLSFTYAGGTVVEMPGTLQADDALLGGDDNVKVDGDGYICFSEDGNVPNCWATWQTNWVKTGTYDVILDVNATTNGHQLVVEVLDGETVIETFEHVYSTESGKLSIGKFVLPETKSYTIRLKNKQDWSDARIKSIAFIPFITIDNDDTNVDFTEYKNQFVSIQFNRTFTGGMYNPICLPFALSSTALQNILKSEKSYVLDSASLEEQKLYVELKQGSSIYQGTPNMIKPSEDVENPVFTNVEIKATSPDQTTRGVLRLQGSFASHAIDKNALLVGANNTLFFPNDETPYIKSMRAYFILVGQAAKAPIKAACFREPGNAPTWMPIVGAETEKPNGKFIRDGRFVIVREGKEYNAQGIEL